MTWTNIYGIILFSVGFIVGIAGTKDIWTWKHPVYGAIAFTLVIVSIPLLF